MARCARLPLSGFAGLLHGKACHTILRSLRFLTNRVPLPPLFRGQNKTPRNTLFINGSTVSTSYCATELRGWQRRYKKWRRRRRTSPAQRYYIPPESGRPEPACKAKPITGRTLGAQGQRPGGAINPHARKGVSTFGNTGKHRPRSRPRHRRPLSPSEPGPPSGPIRISLFF